MMTETLMANALELVRRTKAMHLRGEIVPDDQMLAFALADALMHPWQPIESAPKSTSTDTPHGKHVRGEYILGYCPDETVLDKLGCIEAIWWEPNENGGKGCWFGAGGFEVRPTHWTRLPQPPLPPSNPDGKV